MINGRVAKAARRIRRDQSPTRRQECCKRISIKWCADSDDHLGRSRSRRSRPRATDARRHHLTNSHMTNIADAIRDSVGAASDKSRQPAIDIERQEIHAPTRSAANVGTHVDLGKRPHVGQRVQTPDWKAETVHVKRNQPDPCRTVKCVDFNTGRQQRLHRTGFKAPVRKHDVVPLLHHHRPAHRIRACGFHPRRHQAAHPTMMMPSTTRIDQPIVRTQFDRTSRCTASTTSSASNERVKRAC